MANSQPGSFRWQTLFQRAGEPLFLLNRHRRILFVNRAWEELTGIPAHQARGLLCTPRPAAEPGPWSVMAQALCPPPEVLDGSPGRSRRQVVMTGNGRRWWDIDFFPLQNENGLLCVLGKVSVPAGDQAVSSQPLPEKLIALREGLAQRHKPDSLAGEGPALRRLAEQVRLACQNRVPVLILGEAGTGKQWVARVIHHQGVTREQTFAALDCGRLPPSALAGLLFDPSGMAGQPGTGTLYFKDPSRLPRDLQARLHEFLTLSAAGPRDDPSGTSGPRIIAGCRTDPGEEIKAGRLLEELYCALATLVIDLPPLRSRPEDLARLTESLLERANAFGEHRVEGLTQAAWDLFHAYRWPGNVRELYSVLTSACGRARGPRIDVPDLPVPLRRIVDLEASSPPASARPLPLDHLLEQAERRLIVLALRLARGNKSRAADLLAIWRPRLHRRMEALGIPDTEGKGGASPPSPTADSGSPPDPFPPSEEGRPQNE